MPNGNDPSRRDILAAGLAGVAAGSLPGISLTAATAAAQSEGTTMQEKVRYAELLPHEFRKRLAQRPIAYLPLGTLEWHGEHLPLGSDALQAEGLMIECARQFGGIVMPPIYLGPDRARTIGEGKMLVGMDYADSTNPPRQLDGSCYWVPIGLHLLMVDAILEQLRRAGFRAVFADGHGPSRWSWVEKIFEREQRFGLKLFGVTRDIAPKWQSQIDHAAENETSIVMALRPELVDLSQLSPSRDVAPLGVGGKDPRDATADHGKEYLRKSVELVRQAFTAAGLL